ncbi:YopN family type III secretion system gatekeeper subunit [Salmonella enterica]|nr:YopN family type III secretion system gatekeeper subunit [Salmonella enterica]EHG4041484.1 YopN family type III secretion system gatekeeper subunit [Salmonella enterica]EHG6848592.1 YopN family type III secretion system gatekeeper subunit [Salmonella enterica]
MAVTGTNFSLDHIVSFQRRKHNAKNEIVPTDYNVDTDANTGIIEDTPAAELWKLYQEAGEMSAVLTQYINRRLYEKRFSELSGNYDYILEDEVLDKTDRIFEVLQNSRLTHRELMNLAREIFPDESDLVVVLREFLRQKRISEVIRQKVRDLLKEVENSTDQKFIKSGINSALKARLFGKKLDISPKLLRASYRSFLMNDQSTVDIYIEWISNYGSQKRYSVLEFIEGTLLGDINSLDASCSNVEFGLFLKKFCLLRSLRSAELLFIRYVTENKVIKRFDINDDTWLFFCFRYFSYQILLAMCWNRRLESIFCRHLKKKNHSSC